MRHSFLTAGNWVALHGNNLPFAGLSQDHCLALAADSGNEPDMSSHADHRLARCIEGADPWYLVLLKDRNPLSLEQLLSFAAPVEKKEGR